jgi:hypothetical protein
MYTYGLDGHLCLSKRMVRKICTQIYSEFIYATKYYPQQCESGEDRQILKCGREDIRKASLHNPGSCALRWHKLD